MHIYIVVFSGIAYSPWLHRRMDEEATDAFDGFQAMFNIRGKHFRRSKSADKSADEGISPWKIGMMAACLLIWDVMWEVRMSHHYTCMWFLSLMCCQHMHTPVRYTVHIQLLVIGCSQTIYAIYISYHPRPCQAVPVHFREQLLIRHEHIQRALELVSIFTRIRTAVMCICAY